VSSVSRVALIATFVLCACAVDGRAQVFPPPEGELKPGYDRFTDERTVTLYSLLISEKKADLDYIKLYVTLGVRYSSGTTPRSPDFVVIIFSAWTPWDYQFTQPAALYAIVDGQRKYYGLAPLIENTVINGKYVSKVGGRLAFGDFKEIVKAKSVEMRIGTIEFTLTEKVQNKLQDFAGMITP